MKRGSWFWIVGIFLGACTAESLVGVPSPDVEAPGDEPDAQSSEPPLRTIALRVRGVGATVPVHVAVSAIEAVVDGRRLDVELDSSPIDLSRGDQAWKVGTLTLPADAGRLALTVRLAPAGDAGEGASAERVDAQGVPISLSTDAALAARDGKLVLDLDVPRSLVRHETALLFVPHLTVRF